MCAQSLYSATWAAAFAALRSWYNALPLAFFSSLFLLSAGVSFFTTAAFAAAAASAASGCSLSAARILKVLAELIAFFFNRFSHASAVSSAWLVIFYLLFLHPLPIVSLKSCLILRRFMGLVGGDSGGVLRSKFSNTSVRLGLFGIILLFTTVSTHPLGVCQPLLSYFVGLLLVPLLRRFCSLRCLPLLLCGKDFS